MPRGDLRSALARRDPATPGNFCKRAAAGQPPPSSGLAVEARHAAGDVGEHLPRDGAEVTRDLFRADDQPEQSYSERQIFEAASSRLARELAAIEQIDEPKALEKILEILNKAAAIYNKDKVVEK